MQPRATPWTWGRCRPERSWPQSSSATYATNRATAARPTNPELGLDTERKSDEPPENRPLLHSHEVDHEHQRLVGRDRRRAAHGAVPQCRRDHDLPAAAHLHAHDALREAGHHAAQGERGRLTT